MQADCVSSKFPETPSHERPPLHNDDVELHNVLARGFRDNTQTSLLFEAIKDTQGTIRAIDTKVGILLAALAIPFAHVAQAVSAARGQALHLNLATGCGSLALTAYVVAGFVAIRALMGTGNVGAQVSRSNRPPDVFYLGGLYRLGWLDAALNRRGKVSRRELDDVVSAIPDETDGILRVLVNELMTLAYVRDVKVHRQRIAFELTALAFVLAIVALVA